jgi:tetratricopeptide (TPR) repeat protein
MNVHPGAILSGLVFVLLIGWLIWRWSRRSEDPPGVLVIKLAVSGVLLAVAVFCIARIHPLIGVPLGAACGIVIGVLWGRNIGAWVARPLAGLYDGGDEAPEPRPFYAIAEAHRKQARYAEAIAEIDRQLEGFPGDLQGLLMLAEIRARHLGDWAGARNAIDELFSDESLPVATRAKALQALADWHLDFANDAENARECLQCIIDAFPSSPEANDAAQRLAHLGDNAWRLNRHAPAALKITPLVRSSEWSAPLPSAPPPQDPEAEAEELRRQLMAHPNDADARERLAMIYAEGLGRMDWAIGELEQLLAQAHHPPRAQARWLHLIADLNIRQAGDESAARTSLQRVIQLFPNTALAANAQSRLDHLKLELRAVRTASRLKPWSG